MYKAYLWHPSIVNIYSHSLATIDRLVLLAISTSLNNGIPVNDSFLPIFAMHFPVNL